ncbi:MULTISPECIES: condensation domain-containing protein [Amycolatopsis]|uniref:Condensation domain-containing protein n=1 Tax=Amycolatopsis albidoflavus TaxID=102226 RepID=A0ABW5HX94_9PSEU
MSAATAAGASFAQQRIWFSSQLGDDPSVYNVTVAADLTGALHAGRLGEAFRACSRRHESLRTCFRLAGGRLQQIITGKEVALRFVDLTGVPEAARTPAVDRLVRQEADEPFDLGSAPLLRLRLLKTAENRHLLLVTFHHIVADAWSLDNLLREAGERYEALQSGDRHPPPMPRLQYADYAAWQHKAATGEGFERQLSYWHKQIEGLPTLVLPADRPRPSDVSFRGSTYRFPLDHTLAEKLAQLGRDERVSLFMTLLAGFLVVLHRCSGQTDLVLGTAIAGRDRPETDEMIGLFVNMLVLRTPVRAGTTLREVLADSARTCQDAYDHQDVPFERLVEMWGGDRRADRHPLFQAMFQLIRAAETRLPLPGVRVEVREIERPTAKFDLSVTVTEAGGRLTGDVEYSTDLFDAETVTGLVDAWLTVLRRMTESLDESVGGFPLGQNDGGCLDESALPAGLAADDLYREPAARPDGTFQVLDAYRHPVPPGLPGDLWAGGAPPVRTEHRVRRRRDGGLELVPVPEPAGARRIEDDAHVPPEGRTEEAVAAVWAETLGVEDVGRHDNFFALGGHSLLATVVLSLVQERLGADVALERFFDAPTVASLAEEIRAGGGSRHELSALVDDLEQIPDLEESGG